MQYHIEPGSEEGQVNGYYLDIERLALLALELISGSQENLVLQNK